MLHSQIIGKPSVSQVIAAAQRIRGKAGVEITNPFITYKYGTTIEGHLQESNIPKAILEKAEGIKDGNKHDSENLGKMLMAPLGILLAAKHEYPGERYFAHFEEGGRVYVFEADVSKSSTIYPLTLSLYNVSEDGDKQLSLSLYRSYGNGSDQEPLLSLYVLAHILNFGGRMDDALSKIGKMLGLKEGAPSVPTKERERYGSHHYF